MNFSCDNCNLNYNLKIIKDRLEHAIVKENKSLLDNQVIYLSQLLDKFIYKCTFCNKNINCLSKINSDDILNSAINSNLQYLRDNHFLISIYWYVYQGIKNNQLTYLSMDENLYKDLLNIFKSNSLPTEYIKLRSIEDVIASNKKGGLLDLEDKIKNISSEYDLRKYSGYRWISQPTYAITRTNLKDFLDWEMNLDEALRNIDSNSSLEFVYKKYNYAKEDKYINEPVIDKSLNIDSYALDNLLFKGLDYKFK